MKKGARFHILKGPLAENCDRDTSKNNIGIPTNIINIAKGKRKAPVKNNLENKKKLEKNVPTNLIVIDLQKGKEKHMKYEFKKK